MANRKSRKKDCLEIRMVGQPPPAPPLYIDSDRVHASLAEFVHALVRSGKSLAGADFSKETLNLRRLDLSGADFRHAALDGVTFSGCKLKNADFSDSSMEVRNLPITRNGEPRTYKKRTTFLGCELTNATFDGSRMRGADLSWSKLQGAAFRQADLTDVSLRNASATSVSFYRAKMHRTVLREASLLNSDFTNAELIEADLRAAKIEHDAFGDIDQEIKDQLYVHMPDRTRSASVINCLYDEDTELSDTVPRMIGDRERSRKWNRRMWAATTTGVVMGSEFALDKVKEVGALSLEKAQAMHVPALHAPAWDLPAWSPVHLHPVMHMIGSQMSSVASHLASVDLSSVLDHVNSGMGFIAIMGAVTLVREGIMDGIKDKARLYMEGAVRAAREMCVKHYANRASLVVAMCGAGGSEPLRMALAARAPQAEKHGIFTAFRVLGHGLGDVVVCDRKHLALALATLSMHRTRGYDLRDNLTFIRCDKTPRETVRPCAVTLFKNGTSSFVWNVPERGMVTTRYDRSGVLQGCWDVGGNKVDMAGLPPAASRDRASAAIEFEAATLEQHELGDFDYPKDTHILKVGRDGSLLVQSRNLRVLDNPGAGQPAIITPDDRMIRIKTGSFREPDESEPLVSSRPRTVRKPGVARGPEPASRPDEEDTISVVGAVGGFDVSEGEDAEPLDERMPDEDMGSVRMA